MGERKKEAKGEKKERRNGIKRHERRGGADEKKRGAKRDAIEIEFIIFLLTGRSAWECECG